MLRRLLPILLVLTLAGCSQSNGGTPQPPRNAPLPHTDFGVPLAQEYRQNLELAERIRAVDPCGLIDQAKLGRYGAPAVITTQLEIDGCTVKVRTDRAELLAQVDVSVHSYATSASDDSAPDKTFRVAGLTLPVSAGYVAGSLCGYTFPVSFSPKPAVRERQTLTDPVGYVDVEARFFGDDTCAVAKEMTSSAIDAVRDNRIPRRDQGRLRVPLTDRSPCELIARLPQGYSVSSFTPDRDPFACSFRVEDAESKPGGVDVKIAFALQNMESVLRPVGKEQRIEQIAGRPVLFRNSGDNLCQIGAPVGSPVASVALTRPPLEPDEHQAVMTMSGPCPFVDAVAPVALDMFGANH